GQQHVDLPHIAAALELWRYSRQSIQFLFQTVTGNRIADRILAELRQRPDLDRSGMHEMFARNVDGGALDAALALLDRLGLAHGDRVRTGGRPRDVWRAGPRLEIQ